MKRKILYITILALVSTGAFLIGKNTSEPTETINPSYNQACDIMKRIVDFNTDGRELSVTLEDGMELYVYREPNTDIYKENRIVDVIETTNGKIAIKQNGRTYNIEEKEVKQK